MHSLLFFFFNDTATTEIYTLSLHDALPISAQRRAKSACSLRKPYPGCTASHPVSRATARSCSTSRYARGPRPLSGRAASTWRTWRQPASSSENTPTVGIPRPAAARAMRIAISPRLATSRRARLIDGVPTPACVSARSGGAAGAGPRDGDLSAAGLEQAKENQAFARHSGEVRRGPQPPHPRDVDDGVHQPCPEEHGGAEAGLVVGQSGRVHHEHEGGEVREVLEHGARRPPCPLGPWRRGRRGLPGS